MTVPACGNFAIHTAVSRAREAGFLVVAYQAGDPPDNCTEAREYVTGFCDEAARHELITLADETGLLVVCIPARWPMPHPEDRFGAVAVRHRGNREVIETAGAPVGEWQVSIYDPIWGPSVRVAGVLAQFALNHTPRRHLRVLPDDPPLRAAPAAAGLLQAWSGAERPGPDARGWGEGPGRAYGSPGGSSSAAGPASGGAA
jgi:hypothetical protein